MTTLYLTREKEIREMITYHRLGYYPHVTGNHNGERIDEIPDRDTMQLRPQDLKRS